MQMKLNYHDLEHKANTLEVRERVLMGFTALVVVTVVLFSVAIEPALIQYTDDKKTLNMTAIEVSATMSAIEAMKKFSITDPNEALRQELLELKNNIRLLDEEYELSQRDLVQPGQMSDILAYVLGAYAGLDVVSVKTLAPKAIEGQAIENLNLPKLYMHRIELQLVGTFFQAKKYVRDLEGLEKKIYLESMQFFVTSYPEGKLDLTMDIISTSEAMFGDIEYRNNGIEEVTRSPVL
ncbi:MAG: hypothetical protein COB04_07280 [Gammaproteobacteria bacterium]|nr:MAG: hypothetical protein COB04_07280 [Gammaproteobacteria bacterium]